MEAADYIKENENGFKSLADKIFDFLSKDNYWINAKQEGFRRIVLDEYIDPHISHRTEVYSSWSECILGEIGPKNLKELRSSPDFMQCLSNNDKKYLECVERKIGKQAHTEYSSPEHDPVESSKGVAGKTEPGVCGPKR